MSGFINPGDYPALESLLGKFADRWPEIFREGVEAINLFYQSPEVNIQDADDVRLYLLPVKWQGEMADKQLPAGEVILDCVPTAAALSALPLVVSVQYSMSMPGCEISPHVDNEQWIGDVWRCHLGLSCPADCALTVDGTTREWVDGQTLVFDSARVEHSAYNRSSRPRMILIIDVDRKALKK